MVSIWFRWITGQTAVTSVVFLFTCFMFPVHFQTAKIPQQDASPVLKQHNYLFLKSRCDLSFSSFPPQTAFKNKLKHLSGVSLYLWTEQRGEIMSRWHSELTQTGSGPDWSAAPVLSLCFPKVKGHTENITKQLSEILSVNLIKTKQQRREARQTDRSKQRERNDWPVSMYLCTYATAVLSRVLTAVKVNWKLKNTWFGGLPSTSRLSLPPIGRGTVSW